VDVINSDSFRLDLTMTGQDCNTQSVVRDQHCSTIGSRENCKYISSCRVEYTPTPLSSNATA
jgi:hypothetical protein